MKSIANIFFLGSALFLCLVLAATSAHGQYFGGIIVSNVININGNNVTLDSFDSSDPNHSIWQTAMNYHGMPYGLYSDTLSYVSNSFPSHTANALMATDGSIINVGNANIYGYVATAPGGAVDIAANGSVGDLNWVYIGNSGVEPGHAYGMNQVFYSKNLPIPTNSAQTNWWPVPVPRGGSTNIGGVSYPLYITNKLNQGNSYAYYSMGQLNQNIYINASNVVLYLTNGWSYSLNNTFMLNSNADVQIYTSGNISTVGNAVVDNVANYAKALSIYDVAGYSNLVFSFAGNGIGTGYIYAPSSRVSFAGGGSSAYGFVGGIFCNILTINGHFNFHFDTALVESCSLPVLILQQPTNQIAPVNSNPTFNVQVNGPTPVYQWYFNQTNPISGAVNSSLALTDVQLTNAGCYSVVITNDTGSVTSALASLTIYTNAAATMSGSLNATNGQFQLNVAGVVGLSYEVQASSNLVNWITLWTNTSPFSVVESNSAAYPQEFYRSVFVP